jgi:hypothetical protein
MDTYLASYGTEWQTVPCPICRKRISFHIILSDAIEKCEFSEIVEIVNNKNLYTECVHGKTLVHIAANAGKLEVVKHLIKMGLPADTGDSFGLTPLYYAAFKGHLDIVKYFVENFSVDIHRNNLFGQTLLDIAKRNKHNKVVEYLENRGARTGPFHVDTNDPMTISLVVRALCQL